MSGHDTLFRHLAMLQLIPRKPHFKATTTIKALLEERGFSVEMRTIQRDLERMSSFFPLVCDREQKPFRWSFLADFKSNLPALDPATALTMVLAEQHVKGLLPQVAADQLSVQFQVARQFLDSLASNGFAQWKNKVRVVANGKALLPAKVAPQNWQAVTEALLMGQALDVEYLARTSNSSKAYVLHPQGLVTRHSVTYLLATVNDYEDIRQFPLQRIRQAIPSRQAYRLKADFDVQSYIDNGGFGYAAEGAEKWVTLRVRIDQDAARMLSETHLSEQQSFSEPAADGWVELTAVVPNDQQTLWWLQGFGARFDVLEPQEWREAIREQARQILAR